MNVNKPKTTNNATIISATKRASYSCGNVCMVLIYKVLPMTEFLVFHQEMNRGSDSLEGRLRFWTRLRETDFEEQWRLKGESLVFMVIMITTRVITTIDVTTTMEVDISVMK